MRNHRARGIPRCGRPPRPCCRKGTRREVSRRRGGIEALRFHAHNPYGVVVSNPRLLGNRKGPVLRLSLLCFSGKRDSPVGATPLALACRKGTRREVSRRRGGMEAHCASMPTTPAGSWSRIHACSATEKARPFGRAFSVSRASGIRTHDPLHPMQVRYQTALLPVSVRLRPCDRRREEYTSEFLHCQAIFFMIHSFLP